MVALLLDVPHLLLEVFLPTADLLIEAVLYLRVEVEGQSRMILKLILSILDQMFRISNDLI